jgi:hypothetical protein
MNIPFTRCLWTAGHRTVHRVAYCCDIVVGWAREQKYRQSFQGIVRASCMIRSNKFLPYSSDPREVLKRAEALFPKTPTCSQNTLGRIRIEGQTAQSVHQLAWRLDVVQKRQQVLFEGV